MNPVNVFTRFSFKKKIVTIVAIVIVAFIGLTIFGKRYAKPKYTIEHSKKSDIVEMIEETGLVSLSEKTEIFSPTNGIVQSVSVNNGDNIIVGQELFTIQSTATEQEKALALAQYLAAKNTLDTTLATLYSLQSTMFSKWNTFKELAESDKYEESDGKPKHDKRTLPEFHVVEKDWLAAESNYKKQQAVISQAQAAVSNAYLLYQATQNATIKATANGTVTNISVTMGSSVKQNTIAQTQTPLAIIAGNSVTEVIVSLSENDIAKVNTDQEVKIDVSAVNDKEYSGRVKRVDFIGTNVLGVIRYNVYIDIMHHDEKLRPGMKADVTIITNKLTNVLSVPNAAIKPHKGGKAVRVPDSNTNDVTYIPVVIGVRGKEKTQILEGIQEDQAVITSLSNEQIKRPGLFGN